LSTFKQLTLPAANRAGGNAGEVLRGNEGVKRLTDLTNLNPGGGATETAFAVISEPELFLFVLRRW